MFVLKENNSKPIHLMRTNTSGMIRSGSIIYI